MALIHSLKNTLVNQPIAVVLLMIHKIVPLIAYMSKFFTLKAGDVVLTGTPDGVGPLQSGDELTVTFDGHSLTTRVL